MKNPRALRHRGTIQQLVTADPEQTSTGESTAEWTDFMTAWMSIEPLTGNAFFAAQQHNAEVDTRIRMRYHPGIKPLMRVIYADRAYNVVAAIDPEMRRRELELMTKVYPLYEASAQGYLLWEDGGWMLDEDGYPIVLEDISEFPLGWESGGELLWEDGSVVLLD